MKENPSEVEEQQYLDLSDKDVEDALKEVFRMVSALKFWVETIDEEEDQELLEMSIGAIQEIIPEVDMKKLIREGHGEYKLIQKKCIERGLV